MPSPVAHAIAGVAAGWFVAGVPRADPAGGRWREAAVFALLGTVPDVDLLFGAHSGPTHSFGAAIVVGVAAFAVQRVRRRKRGSRAGPPTVVFALACMAAYGTHILLDWLARDSVAPIGIMALWPFSREHFESDLHLFMAISRRYHEGWAFVRHNFMALVRELLILVPVLTLVTIVRPRRGAASPTSQ
jgi:membrane-bound metal-dependent hydrolase YbcI (DUF457 family)